MQGRWAARKSSIWAPRQKVVERDDLSREIHIDGWSASWMKISVKWEYYKNRKKCHGTREAM